MNPNFATASLFSNRVRSLRVLGALLSLAVGALELSQHAPLGWFLLVTGSVLVLCESMAFLRGNDRALVARAVLWVANAAALTLAVILSDSR